ncbi:outer membrane beta-barrel protein [Pigmentibacter sp. JX0631]|uniref:outer membrane beta-barrel protein n=1 Tax=Pigmentibacter sp. JX0631 TaxID=2976982 RepID=UPI0024697813|nr:outer membrane beta-barrel protein [Pigmentibacter sp. JX0631]WGL59628.1 outer membrane beta-barrel protein [Pigmentibacter sp. JX0631]
MFAKKMGYTLASLVLTTSAFAAKKSSDVQINAGYTNYSGFSDGAFDNNFNGGNLGVTYLYSIYNDKIAPVVGGGLNTQLMRYSYSNGETLTLNSYEGVIKAGAKFELVEKVNMFALVNAGYSFYNYINTSFNKGDFKVQNTYSFGASLIATYDLSESLNVGLGYTYNRRNLKVQDTNYNKDFQYNEHSANVIVGFNF